MLTIRTICITLLSAFALQANAWMGRSDFQRAERFIIPNSEFRICDQRSHDGSLQGSGGVGGLLSVNIYTSTNNSPFSISQLDETYLPTYDANGNISEYINATDGIIAAHYDYSPFGEQILASGTLAEAFSHRFSTKPFCPYTGLVEYQKRKYDPSLGRWLSRDPIEEQGGVNLYVMCENNGIDTVDSLGEIPLETIWDLANVVYDIIVGDYVSLATDTAALFVPYVPAGGTKLVKVAKISEVKEICPNVKKLTVSYEYKHVMYHFARGPRVATDYVKMTLKRKKSYWKPGTTDADVKNLINSALQKAKSEGLYTPLQLRGYTFDTGKIIGASYGKEVSVIKLQIETNGNIHAHPFSLK